MTYRRFVAGKACGTAALAALAALEGTEAQTAATAATAATPQPLSEPSAAVETAATAATAATPQVPPDEVMRRFEVARAEQLARGLDPASAAKMAALIVKADLRNDPRLIDIPPDGICSICGSADRQGDPLLPFLTPHRGRFAWLHLHACWPTYVRRLEEKVVAAVDCLT